MQIHKDVQERKQDYLTLLMRLMESHTQQNSAGKPSFKPFGPSSEMRTDYLSRLVAFVLKEEIQPETQS